jgi:hypothetical protein
MDVEEFHKRLREIYLPPAGRFTHIDVPETRFAVIDGSGNPEGAECADAAGWLYSVVHVSR